MGWEGDAILFNDQANDEELVCGLSYFIYIYQQMKARSQKRIFKRDQAVQIPQTAGRTSETKHLQSHQPSP